MIILTHLKKIILSPLFIGIIFFLLIQLQFFNLNIDFRDEGLLLSNAVRITNGEIPYKDFPLITTPGTYYIQAFAMKIFGSYIITDRIIYILCFVLILILSNKLFKFSSKYLNYLFLILLSVVYVGEGAYGFYNIEGLVLILTSFLFFKKLQKNNTAFFYSFLIGAANSLVFIFKQSYGSLSFLSFLLLIMFFTEKKQLMKNVLIYLGGILSILIPFFLYFYFNKAFYDLIYYIFYFSSEVKGHRLPFLITTLLFIPFFIFVFSIFRKLSFKKVIFAVISILGFIALYFIISPQRINYLSSTLRDLSTYYFLFFLVMPLIAIGIFIKSKKMKEKQIIAASILSFCVFLASASSGRDYATVVVVSPLYISLVILIFDRVFREFRPLTKNITLTLILFLFIFPSVTYLSRILINLDRDKTLYEKMSIEEGKNILIPQSQNKDLNETISYVNFLSLPSEKLLCFPYCPMLNYLSEKKSASRFNFFYPETFRIKDQVTVINDLKNSKGTVILLQKPGSIEKEANFEDKRLSVLKKFITDNYKSVKTTQNFYIYTK